MTSSGNAWQRSLEAAEAAGQLLNELGITPDRQIDVFSMCEDVGLWLTFMPMDSLLGAFVPEGSGGVLITDRRPITVQRYTAAHELGHWRLEHGGFALDGDEFVLGTTSVERERLAQIFAANLLMPAPLVLGLLARVGADGGTPLTPRDAYFVARETGVSYEAAVRQLRNLEFVTPLQESALLDVHPIIVKGELAGGRRPVYGYADVWPVDEAWNDQLLTLHADDEVVISLPENRSTGYRWMFDDEVTEIRENPVPRAFSSAPDKAVTTRDLASLVKTIRAARPMPPPTAAVRRATRVTDERPAVTRELPGGVAIVGDDYRPGRLPMLNPTVARRARLATIGVTKEGADAPVLAATSGAVVGASGRRLFGVRFREAGPKTLRLQHRSPYSSAAPVEEYVLHAVVEPRRHGFSVDQLIEESDEGWVAEVRERKLRGRVGDIEDGEAH
jgi:hypothetical protein